MWYKFPYPHFFEIKKHHINVYEILSQYNTKTGFFKVWMELSIKRMTLKKMAYKLFNA